MNYHMEVGHDFVGAEMGLGWASGLAIALSLFKIKSLWMNSFKGRLIGEIVVAIFITAVNHIPSFRARYRLRGQVQSHSSSNNELTVAAYFFVSFHSTLLSPKLVKETSLTSDPDLCGPGITLLSLLLVDLLHEENV